MLRYIATPNYEVKRPLYIRRNKKVIQIMKDEFDGRIVKELVMLRPNMHSYLTDEGTQISTWWNAKFNVMSTKSTWKIIKQYYDHSKSSGVELTLYSLRQLRRLYLVEMMTRDYRHLIDWHHIHMTETLEQCAIQNW